MLVLLVIFIITAPLFQQAVPVDLPRVDSTRMDDKPHVLQLAIDNAGNSYLEGQALTRDALAEHFQAAAPGNPELHLRADRDTRYERVTEVMALAQKYGITRIAFVTEGRPQSAP
jgi:biopolymer transport protein ExbD